VKPNPKVSNAGEVIKMYRKRRKFHIDKEGEEGLVKTTLNFKCSEQRACRCVARMRIVGLIYLFRCTIR
jgi:hypothetical protein